LPRSSPAHLSGSSSRIGQDTVTFPRPAAEVLTSTSLPTRPGQDSASSSTVRPPMETPSTFTRSRDSIHQRVGVLGHQLDRVRRIGLICTASSAIVECHHPKGPFEPGNERGQQRDVGTQAVNEQQRLTAPSARNTG
jgi:hypothetical protein